MCYVASPYGPVLSSNYCHDAKNDPAPSDTRDSFPYKEICALTMAAG